MSQLGIDIGTTRLRVAHVAMHRGTSQLQGVAVRDMSMPATEVGAITDIDYLAALLDDCVTELGTRERRCVCAVREPHARLRAVRLPKMRSDERAKAASFEARRLIDYPIEEAVVRLEPIPSSQKHALGVVRSAALDSRISALRKAGLRVSGVDHESCALVRSFTGYDGVVDIGYEQSSLHIASTDGVPVTLYSSLGSGVVTDAIARDLAIDANSAEKRKRILGTAGAGDSGRARVVAEVVRLIETARAQSRTVMRLGFTGNGSRLPRLVSDVESMTGVACEIAVGDALKQSAYPDDVIRAAATDWSLAASLAALKTA